MYKIILVSFLLFITSFLNAQNNKLYTEVLKTYVKNGLVDYSKLKKDNRLNKYVESLSKTNPTKFLHNKKLAFWINAYNAFTLKIVVENYPIKSITELHTGGRIIGYLLSKTVWDKEFITINKKRYSLNDIEHKILRKTNEPRIHFAIVCASISCPVLRNEAYTEDKIEQQLTDQTKRFLSDPTRNYFDVKNREAYISKIFRWFSKDFGSSDENILKFITKYLPENISKDIKNNIDAWDISYQNYNWNLNDSKK